jgi:hypothetical protein
MKNIIWVGTPKCAWSSMRICLSEQAKKHEKKGKHQILTFDDCHLYLILNGTVELFKRSHLEIFNNSWKYTFVRNPWDRLLSAYMFVTGKKYVLTKNWINRDKFSSFEMFVKHKPFFGHSGPVVAHMRPMYDLFRDRNNSCDYFDFIGQFENLQKDFDFISDKIGIPRSQLPHYLRTEHKPYWEYYNDELQEIVAQHYKKDIEYFGYKFREE